MLVVLVGNIGTGKSSFCHRLKKKNRVFICPDKYEGYIEQKQKRMIIEIEKGLQENKDVIIDGVNLTKMGRDGFIYFARKAQCKVICFDFGPGDENSLTRRIIASPEVTADEWRRNHEYNIKQYEVPLGSERFDRIIRINNIVSHAP